MNWSYVMAASILLALYVSTFYNTPILLVGLKNLRKRSQRNNRTSTPTPSEKLPMVSIIVPVKDEEMVIGRLLDGLLCLNYPLEKMEIIIVEGGSKDKTIEICKEYSKRFPDRIKLVHEEKSNGKPSALNIGYKHVRGEIVAVFDADSLPNGDSLLRAVKYFENDSIAAVQGRNSSINADQNVLTKVVSYEEAVTFQTYLQGRDTLGLFVPLSGSCCFIRRDLIETIGGWNSESLSEDLEISIRLALKGYNIKYASDVVSFQESPVKFTHLISQRLRWFRGGMELGLKYGKLIGKFNRKNVDIELILLGSFVFPLGFFGFIITLYGFLVPVQPSPISWVISLFASLLTVVVLFVTGTALVCVRNQRKITNLLWLPFIYAYWFVESFIATYALFQIVFGRPRKWTKTKKTGAITSAFK